MKTFFNIGVLLVTVSAFASSPEPSIYQYWFDGDESSRYKNTHVYDGNSNPLTIDVSGLAEGGHAVSYRMADKDKRWGATLTRYFEVPHLQQEDPIASREPVLFQYWIDNDEAMRVRNTRAYDSDSTPLTVDASGLAEGGHALRYRMANKDGQWGNVMTRYFTVPIAPNKSTNKPVAYRILLNNKTFSTGFVPSDLNFTINSEFPTTPELGTVSAREFKYFTGEKTVTMDASGKFTVMFQMFSENNQWGMPMGSEYEHSVTTSLPVDSVPIPYDYTFSKPDNNAFKAYRFYNAENSLLYLKATQECRVGLYRIDPSISGNISLLNTFNLKQGATTKYENTEIRNKNLIAIVYDAPENSENQDNEVFLRIMFDDNRVPKPLIKFDNTSWEVTISCADQRATIHYTIDGNIPTKDSPKYTGPIVLDKNRRIRAIAVYGDLADSYETEMMIGAQDLQIPTPQLEFAGGKGWNEFVLTNSLDGVTTYYLIGNGDVHDAGYRTAFDGKSFVIADGSILTAYSVKEGLTESKELKLTVKHNDFITQSPALATTKTEGEEANDFKLIKNFIKISVPEGKAKFRIVSGNRIFDEEEIIQDQWSATSEEWLELPGGAFSGNQTVQLFAETDGKARSAVVSHYTDWVKALKPKTEYDNYRLKLSTDMPDGVIRYNTGAYNAESALVYDSETLLDGIDFKEISTVTAWVEAEGYSASDRVIVNKSDYDLSAPTIGYAEDGYLHIKHDVEDVSLTVNLQPSDQKLETLSSNHLRFMPVYNTTVEAFASKKGYNDSRKAKKYPLPKPEIVVDGFNVEIRTERGKVFYTTDGTQPTQESIPYTDRFVSSIATIRAACFEEGEIPSEADSKEVIGQTAAPRFEFNFSRQTVDGVETDIRKIKLVSDSPGATIYYSLDEAPNEGNIKHYNPSVDTEGADVSDAGVIYAYAESEGLRRSDIVYRNASDGYLTTPSIRVSEGVVEITHSDISVTIVPEFTPVQEYEYLHDERNNRVTCEVVYNTVVKAHVEKPGYIASDLVTVNPIAKPVISVDAYTVTIDYLEGDVYYTIDGSLPTKMSAHYSVPFETAACTVRAAAFKDGMIPSEADPKKVMDQAAKPYIEDIIDGHVKLATETPNATIYYSLDQGISDGNRKVYDLNLIPDGIDMTTARSLYAYAEAEGYRRSETFDFFKSANTLSAPTLAYSNGYVVAEHEDNSVEIIFTDEIGNVLMPDTEDPRRVGVPYNSTLDAYAYRKGFISSDKVRLNHTDIPEISVDLFTVSIKKKSYQTVRYTTDGSQPDASSTLYEDTPFTVSESCTIRAVAFEGNLIPSEAEPRPVGYRRSEMPEVKAYDGRYLTLKAEEGSTIRYIIGQSTTDVREGSEYNGKIDMGGLSEVKAIARRADAADSEVFSFIPEFYANDSEVFTSKPGIVKDAFGWTSDMSAFTSLSVHGPLVGASTEDSGDYAFLRSLPNLRHIDLRDVSDTYIPDGALDAGNLLSIVLPAQLTDVGTNIFGDSNVTLCSLELPMDGIVPANLLKGIGNSNLLLYVRSASNSATAVSNTDGVVKNVVVLGGSNGTNRAENVTLRHGLPFHAHKAFDAQKISFTRPFSKQTQIGGYGSGWETMAVPFNVQAIECTGRVLRPFGEADTERGECPFWLFSAADTDWKQETAIYANTPYLIAMPNHPYYADEFVVKGDVVFSSNVVTVPVTPDEQEMTSKFSAGRFIKGSYDWIRKEEGKLAVNESVYTYGTYGDFQPGGIFISGERDIPPFECYVESQGAKAIPVFDRSQVDDLLGDYGTHIWSENRAICVRSGIAMKLRIYDMVGQLIRIVDVKAGETVRVDGITPGIYFVGNTKILVKG